MPLTAKISERYVHSFRYKTTMWWIDGTTEVVIQCMIKTIIPVLGLSSCEHSLVSLLSASFFVSNDENSMEFTAYVQQNKRIFIFYITKTTCKGERHVWWNPKTVYRWTRSSADADNRLDAFSGQWRSTNMVPFHMLHIVSYCAIVISESFLFSLLNLYWCQSLEIRVLQWHRFYAGTLLKCQLVASHVN